MTRLLLLLSVVALLASCSRTDSPPAGETVSAGDTIAKNIDSPELTELNKKLLADPSNASLYHERALLYLRLKEGEAAVNDAKRAIRFDSTNAGYYLALADVYFTLNQTRQVKDLLEITEKKFPDNTEALLKLAELHWLVKQYQKGIDYVNRALRIDEHLARAYYIKGGIYRESGDTSRAVSSLETATEQDNTYTDAFYDLGVIYSARRNPIALQYFENVLRIVPGHADARYGRAKLLQDLGKTDAAIEAYEEMISSDKECARCHYNLGAILVEIKKDRREALKHFNEVIRLEPGNVQAYFARGYTYAGMGDKESARADYNMCLKIDPAFDAAAEGLNELGR